MCFAASFKIYQIIKLKFLKFGKILQILRHLQNFAEFSQKLLIFQTNFLLKPLTRGRSAVKLKEARASGAPLPVPKMHFSKMHFRKCIFRKCIFRKFCKFLAGSFSAVSKRNFARKYAFDSIFQALQDLHTFAPLQSQNFRKKSV